jgi:hypothetical protein
MLGHTLRTLLAATTSSLAFLAVAAPPSAAQTAVTSCGQVVEREGYLVGDLDCTGQPEAAVEVRHRGSLDLRGFRLTGGQYTVLCSDEGVEKDGFETYRYRSCHVFNGTIDTPSLVGIVARKLAIENVTITMGDGLFALVIHSGLVLSNLTLELGDAGGILATKHVSVEGSGLTTTGGPHGVMGLGRIKLDGVTASGYGPGFASAAGSIKLAHASLSGGETAVTADKGVTLIDSTVTGHSGTAISGSHITLIGSTVTGNGLDLDADHLPKLDDASTCETSNGWDVCTND